MKNEKQAVAASVTVYRVGDMTTRGRKAVCGWLRKLADDLQNEPEAFAKTFRARYLYPANAPVSGAVSASAPVDCSARRVCEACGWRGHDDDILYAPSPFEPQFTIYACPKCKTIEQLRGCCDEPGCWEQDTCGTPTPSGYRRTCGKHMPNSINHMTSE